MASFTQFFFGLKPQAPAEPVTVRFRAVLERARRTSRFYRSLAPLAEEAEASSPEEWLQRLPRVELLDYLKHSDRFGVADHNIRPPQPFFYPAGESPARVAVIGTRCRRYSHVRVFADYRDPKLARYAPEAIAAPLDTLRALAGSVRSGRIWIPKLRRAVIAYTGMLEGPLTPADHDLFWEVFEVPSFEQLRSLRGELLAWECEAHEGLHANTDAAWLESDAGGELLVSFLSEEHEPVLRLATGLVAEIETAACACGLAGNRVMNLRRRTAAGRSAKTMAATAGR